MHWVVLPFVFFALFLCTTPAVAATTTERQVELPVQQAIETRQSAQKQVDQWRGDHERLTARFELLQQERQDLETRGEALRQTVAATESRLEGKRRQLAEIKRITGEIGPFLDEVHGRLREVSSQDPPFLREERQRRIDKLEEMMADPAVSVGEKYRRLMEGLLVEAEYGLSAEIYREQITLNETPTLVEVFRLGRLRLIYLTLDQNGCGFYNEATRAWEPLANSHLRTIKSAMAMAGKRQPVELLSLPLGRMVSQ